MTFCGIAQATKVGLHDNKTISELGEWIERWPKALKDTKARVADRAIHKVQTVGASVNIPTSQPTGQDREWPNNRWYIQCQKCPKMVENTKREKAKHEKSEV